MRRGLVACVCVCMRVVRAMQCAMCARARTPEGERPGVGAGCGGQRPRGTLLPPGSHSPPRTGSSPSPGSLFDKLRASSPASRGTRVSDGARALRGGQNWCDTPTSPLERKWGVISPQRRQCACRGHGLCERQSGVVTPARGGPSPECHPLDTAGGTRADPPGAPVSTSGLRRGLCATCRWG